MSDILGDAPPASPHDVVDPRPGFFADPLTLALIAFPLSILVIQGSQIFRGVNYALAAVLSTGPQFGGDGSVGGPDNTFLVAAAFLTAAFSLLPVVGGWRGLARVTADDPGWVIGLLRASVVLGGLSVVLRLVIAVIIATNGSNDGLLLNYLGAI